MQTTLPLNVEKLKYYIIVIKFTLVRPCFVVLSSERLQVHYNQIKHSTNPADYVDILISFKLNIPGSFSTGINVRI